MSSFSSANQAKSRDLKHRVLNCLHKLSDRDTHSSAASELESIARTLSGDSITPFISYISATDSSDKSPVRRHCVKLIAVLSEHHKNSLSPYLSKLLSTVVRRLHDPDSAVRSACVAASLSLSSNVTSPPFASMAKPFLESLFLEQDQNAENGAALCLAAVIEGSMNPDASSLRRMLPRFEKLAKCESFKAKAALLTLIGSVIQVKGVFSSGGKNVVRNLITCLMEFLSNEDWAARKAAAEALMKIATVEKDVLSEYKLSCLKTFEAKRFDKVKAARETMNQMIEAWKQIPDLTEEVSMASESDASSTENASNGRCPPGSKTPCSMESITPHAWKKPLAKGPIGKNGNQTGQALFRKLDQKKPSSLEAGSVIHNSDNSPSNKMELVSPMGKRFKNPEVQRALFGDNKDNGKHGSFEVSSRVIPFHDASTVVSNKTGDIHTNQKECDELSTIRKQLVQIENQQSNMLDLLQGFIGSSQNGMHSLEARVHGIELALDEISLDLAVSTGRMSQNRAAGAVCCKLPVTEFLNSKLFRKGAARSSVSRVPASGETLADKIGASERFPVEITRFSLQGGRGVIVNPLVKISTGSVGFSGVSLSGNVNNIAA
ncbi:hypothetical protein OROGR_022907 [Orobanche gracilis]